MFMENLIFQTEWRIGLFLSNFGKNISILKSTILQPITS